MSFLDHLLTHQKIQHPHFSCPLCPIGTKSCIFDTQGSRSF
jgi:hypothetical protein